MLGYSVKAAADIIDPKLLTLPQGGRTCCLLAAFENLSVKTESESMRSVRQMNKRVMIGWALMLAGTALWLCGYFTTGHPSLIDWHADTPWWIADFLPNIESEIGMVLMLVSIVPAYWPRSRVSLSDPPGVDKSR